MKSTIRTAVTAAAILGVAATAFPAGFHIREQGAKAMGMANAFVAQADDPSAVFYNPAGIAFLKGSQASLGVTVIDVPETEFRGTTWLGDPSLPASKYEGVKLNARSDIFYPPNFYATTSLKSAPVSFGIGLNSLFPLAKRWDSSSPFRDEVKEISIKPMNVNPTVAYRFGNFSLAVGFDYTWAILSLENSPFATVFDNAGNKVNLEVGDLQMEGTGGGWGYNAGLLWKPLPSVSLGAAYRSRIKLKMRGADVDFAISQKAQDLLGYPSHVSTDGSTDLTLPDTWSFAVAWRPANRLTVEFDVDRFGWSSYDRLSLDFKDETILKDETLPKNWNNTWTYRFGTQLAVTGHLDLRAGYAYDNTPVPDRTLGPDLPDADRQNVSAGVGYHRGAGAVDIAYLGVFFKDRTVSNQIQQGEYRSEAHLFAANLTYSF